MHPITCVGAVVFNNDKVLLVKRANPPNQNLWTIPGGKIRFGESLQQAAEREILEETGIVVKAGEPVHAFDLIDTNANTHYVIIDVIADYISGNPLAADDALAAGWFTFQEIQMHDVENETKRLLATIDKDNPRSDK
jgi:ADP-ribose pyrophosphatase